MPTAAISPISPRAGALTRSHPGCRTASTLRFHRSDQKSRLGVVPDLNYEIYVMNADGTGLSNLSRHALEDVGSCWFLK